MCLRPEFDMFEQEKNPALILGSLNYGESERKKRPKNRLIKFAHLCVYVLNLYTF